MRDGKQKYDDIKVDAVTCAYLFLVCSDKQLVSRSGTPHYSPDSGGLDAIRVLTAMPSTRVSA